MTTRMSEALQDGPTTRKPFGTPFSEWTVLSADDMDGVRWYFHIPSAALETVLEPWWKRWIRWGWWPR
jgi:hypothetical protein